MRVLNTKEKKGIWFDILEKYVYPNYEEYRFMIYNTSAFVLD